MQDAETPPAPELPPLAGEERALVEKYPMPKGVPDAEVNKNWTCPAFVPPQVLV